MRMNVRIEGLEELRARAARMHRATMDVEPALKAAGVVAMTAAMDRIKDEGPGWPKNISGTPLLHGVGRLLASLTVGAPGNVMALSDDTIEAGTNLPVARWMQDGTGIYGPRGEPISPLRTEGFGRGSEHVPRSKLQGHIARKTGIFGDPSVLAFPIAGNMQFFRHVKGSPQRPFLFIDDDVAEMIREVFAEHILSKGDQGA